MIFLIQKNKKTFSFYWASLSLPMLFPDVVTELKTTEMKEFYMQL